MNIEIIEEVEDDIVSEIHLDEDVTEELGEYQIIETEDAAESDNELLSKIIESSDELEECQVSEDIECLEESDDEACNRQSFEIINEDKRLKVPRLDEVRFAEVKPQLILTPNYLKARDALKKLSNKNQVGTTTTAEVVSNEGEKAVFICSDSTCKAQFSTEDEMRLHLDDHAKLNQTPVQCDQCSTTLKSQHFYEKHMRSVHNGSEFMCQVCGKILQNRVQWRSHLRNHDQTLKYKCSFEGCHRAFRVKHHLNNHHRSHTKESPFSCTFEGCSAAFRQKHALTIHLRKHTCDYITCDNCKSPFVTLYQLNKHLDKCNGVFKPLVSRATPKTVRPNSETFKCSIDECSESFKAKISLEKHLTKVHGIEVTSTFCVLCCQDFETAQALKSHQRDHLPFSCLLCSVNFKNESNLNAHMEKSHDKDEVRLHGCDHCPASFKRAEHLRTHIAYKHNESRPYACDSCSYKSPTRQDLNSHMKAHMDRTF